MSNTLIHSCCIVSTELQIGLSVRGHLYGLGEVWFIAYCKSNLLVSPTISQDKDIYLAASSINE